MALAGQSSVVPLMLKVAPDLRDEEIDQIAEQVSSSGFDGVIAANTTLSRDGVDGHRHASESGGLSGAPLAKRSVEVVARLRGALPASSTIIGVGGISSGSDARAMLAAGANALQIYTSFVYQGAKIVRNLVEATRRN